MPRTLGSPRRCDRNDSGTGRRTGYDGHSVAEATLSSVVMEGARDDLELQLFPVVRPPDFEAYVRGRVEFGHLAP